MQGLVQKGYGKLAREICLNHYARCLRSIRRLELFGNIMLRKVLSRDLWQGIILWVGQDFLLLLIDRIYYRYSGRLCQKADYLGYEFDGD